MPGATEPNRPQCAQRETDEHGEAAVDVGLRRRPRGALVESIVVEHDALP
jgi:hypothetical protein